MSEVGLWRRPSPIATLNGLPPGAARYPPVAGSRTMSTSASPMTVRTGLTSGRAAYGSGRAEARRGRRDAQAVLPEHVCGSHYLQPDLIVGRAAEGRRHLCDERDAVAPMVDS